MTRLAAPEDAERTLSFLKFRARGYGLEKCEGQLDELPIAHMQRFKQLVLTQGDQLLNDDFSTWLTIVAREAWRGDVCKGCLDGGVDDTCCLWDQVVKLYFFELAEIRERDRVKGNAL